MRTILIAGADLAASSRRVNLLAGAGYNVTTCPGPWPPTRCGRHSIGYCPLTEGADLDATLEGADRDGNTYRLAVDSGLAHPDAPLAHLSKGRAGCNVRRGAWRGSGGA